LFCSAELLASVLLKDESRLKPSLFKFAVLLLKILLLEESIFTP
jgi:hypothetical protein